jgi:L-rhamnose mutarotase
MARMAADPVTQDGWAVCMPCQRLLETGKDGAWRAGMTEIFHLD